MVSYAVSGFCRWKVLLDYFGDEVEGFEKCCRCDNCLNPPVGDWTIEIRDDEFDREPEPEPAGPLFEVGAQVKVPKYDEGTVQWRWPATRSRSTFPDGDTRTFMAEFVDAGVSARERIWATWLSSARRACTACRASSTSTRGGRWTGP